MSRAEVKVLHRGLQALLRANQLDEASVLLARIKREDPISVYTRGAELELSIRSRRLDEAAVLAEQLVEAFPASARIHHLAGQAAYRCKRYELASSRFEESQRISPHWRNRYWLGRCLTQLGRFERAEALLVEVVAEHSLAERDLGWLYERMNQPERAIEALQRFQEHEGENAWIQSQIERLKARSLGPDRLAEEMQSLLELGEELPDHLVPELVESLLQTGKGNRARKLVASHQDRLDQRALTRIAWICHRLQAYDMALSLFQRTLPWNLNNVKHLNSMEADARRCGQEAELIELYRTHTAEQPRLWGRIRRLERSHGGSPERA